MPDPQNLRLYEPNPQADLKPRLGPPRKPRTGDQEDQIDGARPRPVAHLLLPVRHNGSAWVPPWPLAARDADHWLRAITVKRWRDWFSTTPPRWGVWELTFDHGEPGTFAVPAALLAPPPHAIHALHRRAPTCATPPNR